MKGSASKQPQGQTQASWGLTAIGVSDTITVELDEATSGPEQWAVTVTGLHWDLRFAVSGPQILGHWLEFIRTHDGKMDLVALALGTYQGVPVVIRKDNEFPDRFLLVIEGEHSIFFNLVGTEVEGLCGALITAAADVAHAD